jgi:pyruvate/2-oxoglutarate dehydrogenase complex dihydrolipoamide acyltransferase (E2) component
MSPSSGKRYAGRRLPARTISFTAVVIHAVARVVDEHRIMHAYRRRNQLILFDDVDVNTQIEVTSDGQKIVKPLLVRTANRKSIDELTKEIRAGQAPDPDAERRYRATVAFLSIPRPLRSLAWRAAMSSPILFKRLGGTVGLSSIGMFGAGGGWGIPIAPPTLMITVGGIATKPRYVNGNLEPRELLDITISVDHTVVDGATAARFSRRLADLLEHPSCCRCQLLGPSFDPSQHVPRHQEVCRDDHDPGAER